MAKQNRCVAGGGTRRSRHLPVELQEEVLVRLPVKSLTRFESVCKTWRSKFHSRPFIDSYGIRRPDDDDSKHSLEFFIAHSRKEELMKMAPGLWDLSLSFEPTNTQQQHWRSMMYALGPLNNGVYCLTSHIFDKSRDQLNILLGKIALCNPSTRSYKVTNHFPSDLCSLLSDKIASQPSRAHFGFGKVNSSISLEEDYKVVVLVQSHKDVASFIGLVYSLRSGVWKQIVDRKAIELLNTVYSISYSLELRPRRFLEGCWHWIARGRDHSLNVLSFNIANEAFKLIRGPPFNPYYYLKESVFTLRDRLAVIICYSEIIPQYVVVGVDIWMMMEYGIEESWTRIYKCEPDFHGRFMRLLRIEFRPRRDDEGCEACIKGLSFSDSDGHVIWCDDVGHEVRGDWKSMTNPEGSTYIETLERL